MAIFLAFLPWILFWSFLRHHRLESAAVAGVISTIALILFTIKRGRSVKFLQIGTLIFFSLGAIIIAIFGGRRFVKYADAISAAILAIIMLASIIIKKPFTLQYARERFPKEQCDKPEFIKTNYRISWIWFGAFLFNFLAIAGVHIFFQKTILAVNWLASAAAFSAAIILSRRYAYRS